MRSRGGRRTPEGSLQLVVNHSDARHRYLVDWALDLQPISRRRHCDTHERVVAKPHPRDSQAQLFNHHALRLSKHMLQGCPGRVFVVDHWLHSCLDMHQPRSWRFVLIHPCIKWEGHPSVGEPMTSSWLDKCPKQTTVGCPSQFEHESTQRLSTSRCPRRR